MQPGSATIAIIGGGFSGTVLAANLLRQPPAGSARIMLIERRPNLGCGVAYSPSEYFYQLNVPASRMSASSDDTTHLLDYVRRHLPLAGPDTYLPRQLYGEYLQDFLRTCQRHAARQVQFEHVHGEATAVRPVRAEGPLVVQVGEQQYLADQVVLACGEPPPAVKPFAQGVADLPAYVREPYRGELVRSSDRTLLLIGTGLTMVDVAVAAAASQPALRVTALSRHGRLPAAQASASPPTVLDSQLDICGLLASSSLRQVVVALRRLARIVEQRGGDWREAVTRARECVPELWHAFDETERRRFLRHGRVFWDTHRHRMPPEFAARIAELRRTGQLAVHAGSIARLSGGETGITVQWRPRGSAGLREFGVDRVIDCSGSDQRLLRTGDALWRQLLDSGLASSDPLGLGVRTGSHGVVLDAGGRSLLPLFYLGPMLRAAHWEATAVGELRVRAEALAAVLAHRRLSPHPAATGLA